MDRKLQIPRVINILLGIWLFISAFIWPHTASQFNNAWIVGILGIIFAAIAFGAPQARYLNTALAVWLFISAFALPTMTAGTIWNSVIVAAVMFVMSLLPEDWRGLPRAGHHGVRQPV